MFKRIVVTMKTLAGRSSDIIYSETIKKVGDDWNSMRKECDELNRVATAENVTPTRSAVYVVEAIHCPICCGIGGQNEHEDVK